MVSCIYTSLYSYDFWHEAKISHSLINYSVNQIKEGVNFKIVSKHKPCIL